MENPHKPERNLTLGLTPVALCFLVPIIILGVPTAVNWLFTLILNFYR